MFKDGKEEQRKGGRREGKERKETVAHLEQSQTETVLFCPGTAQSPARFQVLESEKPGFKCQLHSFPVRLCGGCLTA